MVIKGKSIKHAKAHARHLMRADQNDRVEILELDESGASPTLEAIFTEYQALAETLTRSQKGLYIAAINPSHDETLTPKQWTQAVNLLEQQLKLDGQPRTVILHEKKGREHVHVVWQRTDIDREIVIDDGWNYVAHEEASRKIEQEFGLEVTKGVHTRDRETEDRPDRADKQAEHQKAERGGFDLKDFKAEILQAFVEAEHGRAFTKKLEEMGCYLARGDQKNIFMIVPPEGEALKLSSTLKGISAKEWKAKLSPLKPHKLKSVSEITQEIENPKQEEARQESEAIAQTHQQKQDDLKARQSQELERLQAQFKLDNDTIKKARADKSVTGIFLVLEYVTGLAWHKNRQHNREDRERISIQNQEMDVLTQEHRNQRQELDQQRQLDLRALDEAHKPDQPPLKTRFELSRDDMALNEFKMAINAHADYFDRKHVELNDQIKILEKDYRKSEARKIYLDGLKKTVLDAFGQYFEDGELAYQQFQEGCGLHQKPNGRHINKSDKDHNLKKAMDKLIRKPQEFGALIDPSLVEMEFFERSQNMKKDIEEVARRIHYMTVKIEKEAMRVRQGSRILEYHQEQKSGMQYQYSNERLAHLHQIEQKANDLSAKQLGALSKIEVESIEKAKEKMRNSEDRRRAESYLKQRQSQYRAKTRNREHDPYEPYL